MANRPVTANRLAAWVTTARPVTASRPVTANRPAACVTSARPVTANRPAACVNYKPYGNYERRSLQVDICFKTLAEICRMHAESLMKRRLDKKHWNEKRQAAH